MRDFDKEYSDWKKDIYTVLIMGFVLGLIAGILIQSGGGMVDAKKEFDFVNYLLRVRFTIKHNFIQVRILS